MGRPDPQFTAKQPCKRHTCPLCSVDRRACEHAGNGRLPSGAKAAVSDPCAAGGGPPAVLLGTSAPSALSDQGPCLALAYFRLKHRGQVTQPVPVLLSSLLSLDTVNNFTEAPSPVSATDISLGSARVAGRTEIYLQLARVSLSPSLFSVRQQEAPTTLGQWPSEAQPLWPLVEAACGTPAT